MHEDGGTLQIRQSETAIISTTLIRSQLRVPPFDDDCPTCCKHLLTQLQICNCPTVPLNCKKLTLCLEFADHYKPIFDNSLGLMKFAKAENIAMKWCNVHDIKREIHSPCPRVKCNVLTLFMQHKVLYGNRKGLV